MAINTTSNTTTIQGNGSNTLFNFNFVYKSSDAINVYYTPPGGVTQLLPPSNYTLSLNPASGGIWGIGGSVTYPTVASGNPAIPVGSTLTIQRIVPLTQPQTISNQSAFYSQIVEAALDVLCMEVQQVSNRTTQFRGVWITNTNYAVGDIVQDAANGANTLNFYICTTANTSGVWATDLAAGDWAISINVQSIISGLTPISAAMVPVTSAATLALARTNFGLGVSAILNQAFTTEGTIVAAATTDLGTIASNIISITGNTGITSFGNSANANNPLYIIRFTGTPTLTNSGTLILLGGVNYKAAAGDTMIVKFEGSSTWRVIAVERANGQPVSVSGPDTTIASAATTDIGSLGTNMVTISGTTTITSLGSSANTGNPLFTVKFTGALTLTYNASSLILPTAANITTAAGDAAVFEYLGSGNWQCLGYFPASGQPLIGSGIKTVKKQVITSTSTYTPSTGMLYAQVEVQAAGGSGAAGGASNAATGGGAGAYAKQLFTAATIGGSQSCTIGAPGAGVNPTVVGNPASATSFGALISCPGGLGGSQSPTNNTGSGVTGAVTGGDIAVPGRSSIYVNNTSVAGPGADSMYGAGGKATVSTTGTSGSGFGSGSSGTIGNGNATQNGQPAIIYITEYCSQ